MKVLVDATAVPADRGGVGRYVDALLPALDAGDLDLAVVCQHRDVAQFSSLVPGAEVIAGPTSIARRPIRLLWEQFALPRVARRSRADVVLSPHYTMPLASSVPVVVTLHDATFFTHPHLHSPLKARFFRIATRVAVRRAKAIIVPSQATRDEVLRLAGGRADSFTVAYHGVDPSVFHPVPRAEVLRVRARLGLGDEPYVAFLGTLEPRKNVPALIRGWVEAVDGATDAPTLVLAGGKGWDDAVEQAIAAVPSHLRVLRPGYLPLADLAGFLAGSQVVAYPSLGEGFGLPVLEAMSCGAAVVTTRELSLPEVGGDAVAYCGTGEASIADGLRQLLADDQRRTQLGADALARAATFTWQDAAARHEDALRRAAASA